MVREAAQGREFVFGIDELPCPNAEVVLGFREPKYVEIQPRIKEKAELIKVSPDYKSADVVLLILSSEEAMNLSILFGGMDASFRGELGVCGEATTKVYEEKKANLSFLCNGARIFGGFRANELIAGLYIKEINRLEERIEELLKTGGAMCGCRVSDIPEDIINSFKEIGFERGIDYFFGKIKEKEVRVYLNKDDQGRLKIWPYIY
jgi:uncharacterized protein (DUF169 family)